MALDTSIPMSYNPSAKLDIEGAYNFAMNRRKNALLEQNAQMQLAEKQNALRQQRELRNFMATADFNDPKQMYRLAAMNPEAASNLAQMRSSMATTGKTKGEYANEKTNYYMNTVLPFARKNGKQGIISMLDMMRADPDLAGSPIASTPKEFADSNLPDPVTQPTEYAAWERRMGLGLSEFLKQSKPDINFQTTGRGVQGFDINSFSPTYKQSVITAPLPPKSPGNIFNIGDKGFGKVLGESAGKDLTERYNTANDAVESYRNTNDLYKFVNNPDFISGSMGDWRAKAAKFLGLPGVAETDAYFAQKGRDVAREARQFGTGASVTDNDRKYAEQIGAGSRELTPEGIRLIIYASQMLNRYKIKKYNERREFLDRNNPDQNIAGFYEEVPVPPPPAFNGQGWELHRDKNGNYAYVGPGKNQVQEVQ